MRVLFDLEDLPLLLTQSGNQWVAVFPFALHVYSNSGELFNSWTPTAGATISAAAILGECVVVSTESSSNESRLHQLQLPSLKQVSSPVDVLHTKSMTNVGDKVVLFHGRSISSFPKSDCYPELSPDVTSSDIFVAPGGTWGIRAYNPSSQMSASSKKLLCVSPLPFPVLATATTFTSNALLSRSGKLRIAHNDSEPIVVSIPEANPIHAKLVFVKHYLAVAVIDQDKSLTVYFYNPSIATLSSTHKIANVAGDVVYAIGCEDNIIVATSSMSWVVSPPTQPPTLATSIGSMPPVEATGRINREWKNLKKEFAGREDELVAQARKGRLDKMLSAVFSNYKCWNDSLVEFAISNRIVSARKYPQLITMAIEHELTSVLSECLDRLVDISEPQLLSILKYFLSLSEKLSPGLISKVISYSVTPHLLRQSMASMDSNTLLGFLKVLTRLLKKGSHPPDAHNFYQWLSACLDGNFAQLVMSEEFLEVLKDLRNVVNSATMSYERMCDIEGMLKQLLSSQSNPTAPNTDLYQVEWLHF